MLLLKIILINSIEQLEYELINQKISIMLLITDKYSNINNFICFSQVLMSNVYFPFYLDLNNENNH